MSHLVVPEKVAIPADADGLESQLGGLARLALASEWARAAIVAAYVEVTEGRGKRRNGTFTISCEDFAAKGFAHLTSPKTVRVYARAWLDRYPRPKPGEIVALPTEPFETSDAHVRHNSGNSEWYTPPAILDAARQAFRGEITTDPASSEVAQRNVRAERWYDAETDGLLHPWRGNVWLNPPYAASLVGKFVAKVCGEIADGVADQACVLVNNATETTWGQRLLDEALAVCFPAGRLQFHDEDDRPTGAPLQGQMIAYLGRRADADAFADAFQPYGRVLHG